MASQSHQLHFILFPLMAQGHTIPIIDIAKLLAQRGATISIISTPLNAIRYKPVIARAIELGLKIRLHELQFPSTGTGLPEGCENFDLLPSLSLAMNFFSAITRLQPQFEQFLEEVEPKASCIISDQLVFCATEVARKFGIPRIVFHGPGCFPLFCVYHVFVSKILESVSSDSNPFTVPGLPEQIKFTKDQLARTTSLDSKDLADFVEKLMESEREAYGMVINTFEELEPEYVKEYKKLKENKVWCIGPVSLCNKDNLEKAERGNKTSIDVNQCLKWLDSWQPSSVVYACLGSLNNLIPSQMMELGLGLESSNKPFIWVIRGNENSKELKKLILEDGFEERTKGRGLLIWGWAPQVLILSHPAVGAFLTHCGWNSTLEGVSNGVPLITWPLFSDQFYNEKLIVQVLGIGVSLGVVLSMQWGNEEKIGVLVRKEEVEKAVDVVMDGGEEGEERRKKARELRQLRQLAKSAVQEGGSSYVAITLFIEDIMQQAHREEST